MIQQRKKPRQKRALLLLNVEPHRPAHQSGLLLPLQNGERAEDPKQSREAVLATTTEMTTETVIEAFDRPEST